MSRPDTPIAVGTDRIVQSRYRQAPNSIHRSNSLNSSSNRCSAVTAAARLLQEATSGVEKRLSRISTSSVDDSDSCSTASNQGSSSSCMRAGLEMKKGKKAVSQLEEVHSLKMMNNHYLQWRLANAKAEASMNAQKNEAEMKLCSMGSKMLELRDNVKRKRLQLAALRGLKTFTTIVEAQMPFLDEWSILEEDYSNSLSGATNALLNSSFRVPVSAEVRVDVGQIEEALNSAYKAEEMDTLVSELARMVGGEKALVEECGDLLSKNYSSQVKECSLRGALMQWNSRNNHHHQSQESELVST